MDVVAVAPVRVQLSRKKGWRMPPNTVSLSGSAWSKVFMAFEWGHQTKVGAVEHFHQACLVAPIADDLAELRGKNLAGWDRLEEPSYIDVLLDLANRPAVRAHLSAEEG